MPETRQGEAMSSPRAWSRAVLLLRHVTGSSDPSTATRTAFQGTQLHPHSPDHEQRRRAAINEAERPPNAAIGRAIRRRRRRSAAALGRRVGPSGRNSHDAMVLLSAAANDGLDPNDYDVRGIATLASHLAIGHFRSRPTSPHSMSP